MGKAPERLAFSQQYVRGEAHYGAWGTLAKGIGFINTFLTLSALSLYQYGVFQLVLSLYGAANYFTTVGNGVVNNDIAHFIREGKEGSAKKLFYEYSALRLIATIILFCLFFFGATIFAERYTFGFVDDLRLVSFLFLTEFFFAAAQSLLAARLKFAVVASRAAVAKGVQLVALLYFLYQGNLGLEQMFISMIAGSLVSTLTMIPAFIALHVQWSKIPFAKDRILPMIFATYGKWDLYRQLAGELTTRVQPWLIKVFVSTEAVAIFSVATAFVAAIKDLGFPVKTLKTLVPLHMDDAEKSRGIFVRSSRYILAFSILVSIAAAAAVPLSIYLLVPKYTVALPYFFAMLPAIPITALGVIATTFLIALRKQRFLFWLGIEKNVIILAFYIGLLPLMGLWALAIEETVTPLAALAVVYVYMFRTSPGGFRFTLREFVTYDRSDWEFFKVVYKDMRDVAKRRLYFT